jgi:hypothetical protein
VIEGLRTHGVPGPVVGRLIEEYGKKWLPMNAEESEITKEMCYEASKTLQTLVDLLPPVRKEGGEAAESRHLMRLLKVAIRFGATTECREKIQVGAHNFAKV